MNNIYFIFLLFIPFTLPAQTSPVSPNGNNSGRQWKYISGRDSLEMAMGKSPKRLYEYLQENEECASFFVDGKEINIEIMPDVQVVNVWNEEVYTTIFEGDLFPAVIMGGEIMILCRQGGSVFYHQQKLLKAKK